MKQYLRSDLLGWIACLLAALVGGCGSARRPLTPQEKRAAWERRQAQMRMVFTPDKIESEVARTTAAFGPLYKLIKAYQSSHAGQYPETLAALRRDVTANPGRYPVPWSAVSTSGMRYLDDPNYARDLWETKRVLIVSTRPDGTRVGSAKQTGTRDILAAREFPPLSPDDPTTAFGIFLWEDGAITRETHERLVKVPVEGGHRFKIGVVGQAGVPVRRATFPP